jgi:FkbM family methyltransferase
MQYYGQLLLDKVLHQKYFSNKKSGTFIECGAFDGRIESNTLFFYENLNWRGYNFEPVPTIFSHLERNRPHDTNINMALSDNDGVAVFTQAIADDVPFYNGHFGNGSLAHTDQHMNELKNRNCKFEKFSINTITLPTFYKNYNIDKQIDLFVLDVEGYEGKVLSQLNKVKVSLLPKIIATEYGHCGENEINKFLLPLGYSLDYKDAINLVFKLG